jgi:DNA-binding transcriptional LysR family regulator
MNLRQIEAFHALMISGTTTRAAEVLRISQPAVSKAIHELEKAVGFSLFHRTKGRMSPTVEGGLFFREVEGSFLGLIHLKSAAARIRDYGSGEIRVASLSALSTSVMPKAMREFQKRHPKIAITFQSLMSSSVKELVASGQFDVGVAADEIDLAGVVAQPFAIYRVAVAVPSGHRLQERTVIRPEDLHEENFIALAPEDTTRREAEAVFAEHGVQPKIVLETPYSTTIASMAAAGIGCGLVNPITATPFLGSGLRVVPFEPAIYFRTLLLLPPQRDPSIIVLNFIEELMKFGSGQK